MRAEKKKRFLADVQRCAGYIAEHNPDAARRFVKAVEEECEFISTNPQIGSVESFRKHLGVRSWRVSRFENFLIFYRFNSSDLAFLRILHGARNLPRHVRRDE